MPALAAPFAAVPSGAWVEVTHCPNRRATVERRKREIMPLMRWKHRPMWFYVAPGSGVSLNLGKTVLIPLFLPGQLEVAADSLRAVLREAPEVITALSAMYLGIWVGPEAHLKQLDAPFPPSLDGESSTHGSPSDSFFEYYESHNEASTSEDAQSMLNAQEQSARRAESAEAMARKAALLLVAAPLAACAAAGSPWESAPPTAEGTADGAAEAEAAREARAKVQGGPNITANLYCICLSEHETCTYADGVQICGNI